MSNNSLNQIGADLNNTNRQGNKDFISLSLETKDSVDNILSLVDKNNKVVINQEKAKVINNDSSNGLMVKFDTSGETKNYDSIEEMNSFKVLKLTKPHKQKRK